jgi:hypothetical protein
MTRGASVVMAGLAGAMLASSQGPGYFAQYFDRVVTGIPFSGQSVTEVVQPLADGNHLRQESTATVARDSRGRMRYGSMLTGLTISKTFTVIRDPVAGVRYVLDADQKTVQRSSIPPAASESRTVTKERPDSKLPDLAMIAARESLSPLLGLMAREGAASAKSPASAKSDQPEVVSLGHQVIEGVAVTGARASAVLPAGQIGNEKPVSISLEVWYSKDLSIVVLSKLIAPRTGVTTFQLKHLQRVEPAPELFEVPAGYRVLGAAPARREPNSPQRGPKR